MRDFVTVVSGLPRSGTSMMMAILQAGGVPVLTDEIRTADIDNPKGYFEYEPVKKVKTDPSWLEDARGKAVKMVYALLYDLPAGYDYRVLFMRRKLEEVVASQHAMLHRLQRKGGSLTDEQLLEAYRTHIGRIEAWLAAQPNFKVLPVSYHKVLEDGYGAALEIDDFLGSGLDVEAMAKIPDHSLHRNRA